MRKMFQKGKRFLALTLAAALSLSGLPATGGLQAQASTELLNETRDDNDGGTVSAYRWNQGSQGRFDVEGISNPARIGTANPYGGGIRATYGTGGYHTKIKVGGDDTISGAIDYNSPTNGGVVTYNGVEFKVGISTSKDGKFLIVDYSMYNTTGTAINGVKIGSGADVMIGSDDGAAMVRTQRGIKMTNRTTFEVFELLTDEPSIGVSNKYKTGHMAQPGGDFVTNMQRHAYQWTNTFQQDTLTGNRYPEAGVTYYIDTGLSYAWSVDLPPYQKVVKKVAFSTRGTSLYVSQAHGTATGDGTASSPIDTIENAIAKIGTLGQSLGYLYIQDYANPISSTINIPSGRTVAFLQADYDHTNSVDNTPTTITRAAGFNGPMFSVDGGMRISDLTLDGNKSANPANDSPIIDVRNNGKLLVQKGAVLQNNKVTSDDKGSAINLNGSAELEMNYGKVTGNESKTGGAVYHNGNKLEVINAVEIRGNTNDAGKESNLVLAANKKVEVKGALVDSDTGDAADIKVSVKDAPAASTGGNITAANQERIVAEPSSAYAASVADAPAFLSNFSFDEESAMTNRGWALASGIFDQGGISHKKKVVAKRAGRTISFNVVEYPDESTIEPQLWDASNVPTPLTIPSALPYELNASVDADNITPPALPANSKYQFKDAIIDMNGGSGLSLGNESEGYKLKGTMPDADVTVTYRYERKNTTIKFDVNGGTPAIGDRVGKQLTDIQDRSVPVVTKYGYDLKHWDPTPESPNSGDELRITDQLPEKFPRGKITGPVDERDTVKYKAIWEVNDNIKSTLTVTHKNSAGTIEFKDPETSYHPVEYDLNIAKITIPGYVFDPSSSATPTITGNTFNTVTGQFTGDMPNQDLDVNFKYMPDTSAAGQSTLTVKHIKVSDNSTIATTTQSLSPEEDINGVGPLTGAQVAGLSVLGGSVTAGLTAVPASYIYAIEGYSFDPTTKAFTGKMPNQNVTIEYRYGITGTGQTLNVHYIDADALDAELQKISGIVDDEGNDIENNPNQTPIAAGDRIEDQNITTYIPIYGYLAVPAMSKNPVTAPPVFNAATYKFEGSMPANDVDVYYRYTRDTSLWNRITYKPVEGATLGRGSGRPLDLVTNGTELYVDVLKGGNARSYSWEKIKEKNLVPEVTLTDSTYYTHDGWFVDANNNGRKDDSESLLQDGDEFNTAVTVLPNIIQTPGRWFNVSFEIGEHAVKTSGSDTINTRADRTLAAAILEAGLSYTIEPNYLYDNWYMFGNVANLTDTVQSGMVYRLEVKPDASVFGLDPSTKQARGSILPTGRGRVTVYDTKPGYKYVLTDTAGNIINVKPGNAIENTIVFDNLDVGTKYRVYEVRESVSVAAGSSINAVAASDRSDPTEVKVPVLNDNHTVTADPDNDGRTRIIINPADPNMEYALVDDAGNLFTLSPEAPNGWQRPTGSNPASVRFSNLPIGRNFTVITRPAGSSDSVADRLDGGSRFNSDPGVEVEIPKYTLETRKAADAIKSVTRDANNILNAPVSIYEELHEGDVVSLTAPETDENGHPFSHWKMTIGATSEVVGNVSSRNLTITMRRSNLVISAYYNVPAAVPSLAQVEDEVRGTNSRQIALDPQAVESLRNALTTAEDRVLMDTNHAQVTYKIIYNKTDATATASNAVQAVHVPNAPEAFTAAWQLGVNVERYVNGRKVSLPSGHPQNYSGTITSYVQLDEKDIDMLDYKLYEIDDVSGNLVGETAMSRNPEVSGGLFTFEAKVAHSYVLVYNKAFRLNFINNHVDNYPASVQNPAFKFKTYKVRRGLNSSNEFNDWMSNSPIYSPYEKLGVTYTKRDDGWSYDERTYRKYDPEAIISKKTNVYAFYDDDRAQVEREAGDIEAQIARLVELGTDNFLRRREFSDIREGVTVLRNIASRPGILSVLNDHSTDAATRAQFERYLRMSEAELEEAASTLSGPLAEALVRRRPNLRELEAIKRYPVIGYTDPVTNTRVNITASQAINHYNTVLTPRYTGYQNTVSNRSSGGTGGGGGGTGRGTADKPFTPKAPKSYFVGGNGKWEQDAEGRWSFVLTGGIRLTSKWARLDYTNADNSSDGWYHFNSYGLMDTGWFRDEKGDWYYTSTERDGSLGKMKTGWVYSEADKNWYYLDPNTGVMRTGWVEVGGKWYFFATESSAPTYSYDAKEEKWNYLNNGARPMGSMYANTTTPDGYKVGADGALIN